jgi:hypothetical protein
VVLFIVTTLLFALIVFLAGFLAKLMLRGYRETDSLFSTPEKVGKTPVEPLSKKFTDVLGIWLNIHSFDDEALDQVLSLWSIDIFHWFFGLLLVGSVGFVCSVFDSIIATPASIFGGFRRRAMGRRQEAGGISSVQLIILSMIVIGAISALWNIYKLVRELARRRLERLGAHILDVNEARA